jgi:hypothetical protein
MTLTVHGSSYLPIYLIVRFLIKWRYLFVIVASPYSTSSDMDHIEDIAAIATPPKPRDRILGNECVT